MENYDKLKQIGKGSYGVVWLVKNRKDKKSYVLKQIDLRKSSKRDILSAQQEAQLLKRLKHPNIVSYKESFETGGILHIVMLFCEGGDLYTQIKQREGKLIEETQVVEWFVQIAMALQYMHENHILHRDLKTQNIFLTRNKIIKVGDLGIARVLKGNNDMATTMIGTPYYMSPELFANKPYNSKSDVWALGCCVYEMTTLKHAFNAKDMNALVFKITQGKMPSMPSCYSREFIALIESTLNLDPKKRPSVNKILRDPFIKRNIILFLERTKQKQREQASIDDKHKKLESHLSLPDKLSELKLEPKPDIPQSPSNKNNAQVNKFSIFQHQQQPPPKQLPQAQSPQIRSRQNLISPQVSDQDAHASPEVNQRNSQDKEMYFPKPQTDSKTPQVKEKPSVSFDPDERPIAPRQSKVRISTVVQNIETQEQFDLKVSQEDNFFKAHEKEETSENNYGSEEEKPYELTKPPSVLRNKLQEEEQKTPEKGSHLNHVHSEPDVAHCQPKIMDRHYSAAQLAPSRSQTDSSTSDSNDNSLDKNPQMANISARERRRLKLRQSQNESSSSLSDARPPVLRRLDRKPVLEGNHKSEIFYNSENKKGNENRGVSKSYNEENVYQHGLKDSLKIFRQNNPHVPRSVAEHEPIHQPAAPTPIQKNNSKSMPNVAANQAAKPKPIFDRVQSSSSSSVDSSSDDDPGNQLVRLQKRREKDQKEISSFIDQLNSTLNAANKYDSEVDVEDDIQEETIDDIEKDVIEAERLQEEEERHQNEWRRHDEQDDDEESLTPRNPPRRGASTEENDEEDIRYRRNNNQPFTRLESAEEDNDRTLGATNHMKDRIRVLENEILQAIGPVKLQEAYKIMDSFKEDELQPRLSKLIGASNYQSYSGKLWLLKFCKDTSQISIR